MPFNIESLGPRLSGLQTVHPTDPIDMRIRPFQPLCSLVSLLRCRFFGTVGTSKNHFRWGYYKYGGMDEQALLDQACEVLGKFPCRASAALLWRPRCTRRCGVTSIQEQVEMCQFS